jgi:putative peptidoglycan lipid II flippase
MSFFLSLPAAAGLVALCRPLIELIYEWGRFGPADTVATSRVLWLYSLGIPAYCGLQILTRLYYSLEDVKTPVAVGASMVLVNLALNLLLVGPMEEGGLALATSLSAFLNLTILFALAKRRLPVSGLSRVLPPALVAALLAGAMGAAVYAAWRLLADAAPDPGLPGKLLRALPPVVLGVGLYAAAALLFRLPETRGLRRG